jgi:tyrosine-protein kinase Etk/Wzc
MASTNESLLPLMGVFYAKRRFILRVTLAAFLLSLVGSLLMKNYFQGKTIFYAASQDLFKPEKVFGGGQSEMYYYGSGEDIDRILTVGNSNEVIDFLIDSFDLWTVYKVKKGKPLAHYNLRKMVRENYDIMLTKQDALELTIEDRDPARAAAMANAARQNIDERVRAVIKNSQIAVVNSFEKSILGKEVVMNQTLDTLIAFRQRSGIYDPVGQNEILAARVTEATSTLERDKASLDAFKGMKLSAKLRDTLDIIQAKITGAERELAALTGLEGNSNYSLRNFNRNKSTVELLESRYNLAFVQIGYDLEKLKIYKSAIEIEVPSLHVIEAAEVPLRKYRPKRSVIVIACTVAAFLFSVVAVLVMESYRKMDWGALKGNQ